MDDFSKIPMVEGGGGESVPGTFGSVQASSILPDPSVNYAQDEDVVSQINLEVCPVMDWARTNRYSLEEEWRSILRMEMLVHDNNRRYMGRSNSYLPVWARTSQTLVSQLSKGLFPSEDYFNVIDRQADTEGTAEPVKMYMEWELNRVARLRTKIKPFLRQLVAFGNSPLKFWYRRRIDEKVKNVGRSAPTATGTGMPTWKGTNSLEGLTVSPRSMLFLYVWPTSAESLDDCTMIWEDIPIPRSYVVDMVRKKQWMNGEAALRATPPPNFNVNAADQHSNVYGLTPATQTQLSGRELGQVLVISEVWTFLRLPKSAYMPGEDTEESVPVRVVLAGRTPLRVTRNPHWHQRPPFLMARTNVQPGLFYGYGTGRLMKPLQYLANDFGNQTNDVGQYCLNPIVKRNPTQMTGPMRPLSPGVMYDVLSSDAITFDRPPFELVQVGMGMLSNIIGLGQDLGGAPPIMQGIGGGASGKTATQAQILQNNATGPLQDLVEDIEQEVLVPLLQMAWSNAQQFREEAVMVQVAGKSVRVDPSSLDVDAQFEWLASSQAVNRSQRTQQAIGLLQAVMPLVPLLMQQGKMMDPTTLLRRIYSDGFGFRGFDQFIKPMPAPPMSGAPGAPGQPGMPPGPGMQPSSQDRVRSSVEQAPGGSGDMAPGEGEDFMGVRNNADALAGLMGGSNGQF